MNYTLNTSEKYWEFFKYGPYVAEGEITPAAL